MARLRKHHVQQSLLDHNGQRPTVRNGKTHKGWGGKRAGAGRKPKGKRAGSPHKRRPELDRRNPVHVVLRVADVIGNLRKRYTYKALREATIAVAMRELHDLRDGAFRIIHISVQRNHVHLLVEADNKTALSRGMQCFQISAAKHLNRAISMRSVQRGTPAYRLAVAKRRRGTVFTDRFHQEIITTPKQARHTLAYVLNNWRKHKEDQSPLTRTWKVDPFSTGVLFEGWKELAEATTYLPYRDTYQPLVVYLPKTWLLREGWRKAKRGLVGFDEVPSARQLPAVAMD